MKQTNDMTGRTRGAPGAFRAAASRLSRSEDGSAMTEFVICLPVFLLIFMGITNLGHLEQDSVAVKIDATKNTWADTFPVQQSFLSYRMQPTAAAADAAWNIGNHFSDPVGDSLAIGKNVALGGWGHVGESWAAVQPIDVLTFTNMFQWPSSLVSVILSIFGITDPGPQHDQQLEASTPPLVNNMPYTWSLVEDGVVNSIPNGGGDFSSLTGVVNSILSMSGTRPALAAGIRYGMVQGESSRSGNVMGYSYDMSAGYDVLVSPYMNTNEFVTTAITRLAAEECDAYGEVLGIQFSNPLGTGCSISIASGGGGGVAP